MPLISVVIPSYNHGHLIGRALQSILDQNYENWEAIVIDNHSLDQTEQVVQAFKDPRIKLLKIHNNGVIAVSRNIGIYEAKGEWIAFLDSDDWWTSNKLQECVAYMMVCADVIYHDLEIIRDKPLLFRAKKIKTRQLTEPTLIDLLVNGNVIANSSVVVRKSVLIEIGGLNEDKELVACEDYDAWLRIAKREKYFLHIPMKLGYYYLNSQGISNKDMSISERNLIFDFLYYLDDSERAKVEMRLNYTKGRFEFVNKRYAVATQYLRLCVNHRNFLIRVKSLFMLGYILLSRLNNDY